MHSKILLSALALGATTSAGTVPTRKHARQAPTTLDAAFKAVGKEYVGTALTIRDDPQEQGIVATEFGSITPENAMKWESTQPSQGTFTFDDADAVVAFAQENGQTIRCHTLVWYSQLPSWVSSGGFDNATLLEVVKTHIDTVVGRYKGVCDQWDVVNEALNEDGTYRDNVFLQTIGEAYIPIAFQYAQAADPDARLFYNDYNLEYGSDKAQGAARIVQLVQSYGARIDGVGLQGHLTSEPTSSSGGGVAPGLSTLERTLALYTDLGVDVAYTELDVRFTTSSGDLSVKLEAQADVYVNVFQSCLNNDRCIGVTIWGASDKYSWIPGVFEGEGEALVWDDNYQKKPAFQAVLDAINASANSTTSDGGVAKYKFRNMA
ncbi:glycosyl hydrolase family 10 [Diaporthe helianthi]|uniref:Beta-xylanase n=1 Tax=Diaporthe helianthi TaxID=158607 RepID=A0A2P5HU90_DIAHE|nr:glycosyl hydrolase family 10 [Diaporthe helianthi]